MSVTFYESMDASVSNLAVHTHPTMGMVVTPYPKDGLLRNCSQSVSRASMHRPMLATD
jgi:hypothetical protein